MPGAEPVQHAIAVQRLPEPKKATDVLLDPAYRPQISQLLIPTVAGVGFLAVAGMLFTGVDVGAPFRSALFGRVMLGGFALMLGAPLTWMGGQGLHLLWRSRSNRWFRPNQHWLADNPSWNRQGTHNEEEHGLLGCTTVGAMAVSWVALAGVMVVYTGDADPPVWAAALVIGTVIAIPVLLAVLSWIIWLFVLISHFRPKSQLRFVALPYCPGQTVVLDWHGPERLSRAKQLRIQLQYVVERPNSKSSHPRASDEAWVEWEGSRTLEDVPQIGRINPIRLRFDLPDDAPTTNLQGPLPHYWRLMVRADTPERGAFSGCYLIPIYEAEKAAC